jgi:hypothetical protein
MKDLTEQIGEWEYCYCQGCRKIRESKDLKITESGVQCIRCGGSELEAPGWVACPHHKMSEVKCPRAGKGIVRHTGGYDCADRCFFRSGEGRSSGQ